MREEDIKARWEEFVSLLKSTRREGIESLIAWLENETDFKEAPASTRYHLNIKGGLLEHSLNLYHVMTEDLKTFVEILNIPEDTVILTSLLHDVCKANTYIVEMRNVKKNGDWVQEPFYKTDDLFPYGHGEKSVMLIMEHIKLTPVEKMMIRWHMGFSDRMPYDVTMSDAFTKCPQCLILHTADVISTYLLEGNSEGMEKYEKAGFKDLFEGRSVTESLKILKQPKKIIIDGMEYEVAPENAVVDNEKVIFINNNGQQVKVYAPHQDGLPF